jgi:hypothetical protein
VVSESLATQLLHSHIEAACPKCQYPVWVQYAEVVAQSAVLCPCCRTRIWLRDAAGSAQNAGDVIEQQIKQAVKDVFK